MSGFAEWVREATLPGAAGGKPEALAGVRVLEYCPGHFGGMVTASVLGEFGADVVKVEPPGGDPLRRVAPEGILLDGTGLPFLSEARNRRFVTLSPEDPAGRDAFRRLAIASDVVVTSEPPERMEALGAGYLSLRADHPGVVYVCLSTFGVFGPDAGRPVKDNDILCQALSGGPYIVGEPEGEGPPRPHQSPTRLGNWHGWFVQGLWGAFGALAALRFRAETGKGQLVDLSGAEAVMMFADYNITWMHTGGKARERVGNFDPAVFPYTYVRTKDGYTFLAGFSDVNWFALTSIMGDGELRAKFPSIFERLKLENEKQIFEALETWARDYTSDEILSKVQEYDRTVGKGVVATGRVNTPADTVNEENWWKRKVFKKIIDPHYGEILLQMPPWKMSETPPRVKTVCRPVGADNEYIFTKYLGIGPSELSSLREEGVL